MIHRDVEFFQVFFLHLQDVHRLGQSEVGCGRRCREAASNRKIASKKRHQMLPNPSEVLKNVRPWNDARNSSD